MPNADGTTPAQTNATNPTFETELQRRDDLAAQAKLEAAGLYAMVSTDLRTYLTTFRTRTETVRTAAPLHLRPGPLDTVYTMMGPAFIDRTPPPPCCTARTAAAFAQPGMTALECAECGKRWVLKAERDGDRFWHALAVKA